MQVAEPTPPARPVPAAGPTLPARPVQVAGQTRLPEATHPFVEQPAAVPHLDQTQAYGVGPTLPDVRTVLAQVLVVVFAPPPVTAVLALEPQALALAVVFAPPPVTVVLALEPQVLVLVVVFAPPLVTAVQVLVMVVALVVVFVLPPVIAVLALEPQALALAVVFAPLPVTAVLAPGLVVALVDELVVALPVPVVVFAPLVLDVPIQGLALVAAPPLPELEVLVLAPALHPHAVAQVFAPPSLVPPQMVPVATLVQTGLFPFGLQLKPPAVPRATNWSSKHQGSYSSLLGCSYNPMLYFHTKL